MIKIKKHKNLNIFKLTSVIVAVVIFTSVFTSFRFPQDSSADSLSEIEQQIAALENRIREYEQTVSDLAQKSSNLASEVAKLEAEQATIQSMIDLSTAQIKQLEEQIKTKEKEIKDNRNALGTVLADKYINSNITLIERLASSENLSKFVDEETKISVVSDNLTKTVKEIKVMKADLEKKKKEMDAKLEEQELQKSKLVAKKQEQQDLLNKTRGEEAIYQQLKSETDGQRAVLMAEKKRIMDSMIGGGFEEGNVGGVYFRNFSGNMGCSGGYPYCAGSLDYTVDKWGLYARECVSYAAWAMEARFGKSVGHFMGMGNANQWPETAAAYMGAYTSNTPSVGSVAIIRRNSGIYAQYGHAMVVEQILSDGYIKVSQYNWGFDGQYSTVELNADAAIYVHFRNR